MKNETNKFILIADYGRSGQGWLSYMLCYILNATYIEPYNFLSGIKYSSSKHVLSLSKGRLPNRKFTDYSLVIKTHSYPAVNFNLTNKVLYLTRDPRDVAVSAYFRHRVNSKENKGPEKLVIKTLKGKIKHFLLNFKTINYAYTAVKWKKHVLSWEHISSYKVRYEDLSENTEMVISGILGYLGTKIEKKIISEAIENFSFRMITGRDRGNVDNNNPEFRKGIVGDYKNNFNSVQLKIFKIICFDAALKYHYKL